jgi:glycine dehydrogenase
MAGIPQDDFTLRQIGPRASDLPEMLRTLKVDSIARLIDETIPTSIRLRHSLDLPPPHSEYEVLNELHRMGALNHRIRSYIGMGYTHTITPPVILRNVLENPGWYTAYTPYQAEISQGRLEALLNFQTMVMDLTGFEVAGASLLDEATAAAEAMNMFHGLREHDDATTFFVSHLCHPQTIDVVRTRANPRGIDVIVGDHTTFVFHDKVFGALLQYPATDGTIFDYRNVCEKAHAVSAKVAVVADPLALALLVPPAEFGADVALGSIQRFGLPPGFGGPHAAFFATRKEFTRKMPGRLIGVSRDTHGHTAFRMALQTREQHIRREKATSNICTSQVLLAVMASMYAVYHGSDGLCRIARGIAKLTAGLAKTLAQAGLRVSQDNFFDTLKIEGSTETIAVIHKRAAEANVCFRAVSPSMITLTLDEATRDEDVRILLQILCPSTTSPIALAEPAIPQALVRQSPFLTHPTFSAYRSETEMLRYLRRLQNKDLSLADSMIPLGSCTMKLTAAAEMLPLSWPEWAELHPFVPSQYAQGYLKLIDDLAKVLSEVTGFPAVSMQPNSGSQGEYTGLLVIRAYHQERGQGQRNVCLIPQSAHGTNPASAAMAGYEVVVVACNNQGNIDEDDVLAKATQYQDRLAALMLTYPSTHGVFEEGVQKLCSLIHDHGGQVYMDGANMNAQVGLCRPADIGADVCHINLHKTFAIPHGGGGPGAGPIAVAAHLAPFLPSHVVVKVGGDKAIGAVSAAPWGSASILLISWAYARMMGAKGLTQATEMAILNANYVAERLHPHYPVVYRGKNGRVAHECIIDLRPLKKTAGVEAEDVAKRLMDYGFHAPTMSFPIPGTLMIEPTESEPRPELDRFCDALIAIRQEIREIEEGRAPHGDNLLKNAPHTAESLLVTEWNHPYSRERAAYPLPYLRSNKYWPPVGRLDNVHGDRQFTCACPPISSYR